MWYGINVEKKDREQEFLTFLKNNFSKSITYKSVMEIDRDFSEYILPQNEIDFKKRVRRRKSYLEKLKEMGVENVQ